MKIKEYSYFKTVKKTAVVNNLEVSIVDKKYLFDFSLLDTEELKEISDIEKEVIRNDALKNVRVSDKTSFYGKHFDNFTAVDGIGKYQIKKVFSKDTGKLMYVIFTLSEIQHYSKSRNSVYDKYYNIIEYTASNKCIEALNDIEI